MKPRPFYRWKSFWLGLCVLVFLGWAWADSFKRFVVASFPGKPSWQIWRFHGATVFASDARAKYPQFGFSPMRPSLDARRSFSYFRIPDAAIFFGLGTCWFLFLGWRWSADEEEELSS